MYKKIILITLAFYPLLTGCTAAIATGAVVSTSMASDRRTNGIFIEDQSIELKSFNALEEDTLLKESSHISIVSFNRIVLMVGQSPNQKLKQKATDIVRKIENVRRVHNEIRIGAPNSFLSSSNDTWLTTKSKSLMLAETDFPSGHVKVVTENGEIFLMGMVTRKEADKAVAIVRDIDGAERIVQVFEYID